MKDVKKKFTSNHMSSLKTKKNSSIRLEIFYWTHLSFLYVATEKSLFLQLNDMNMMKDNCLSNYSIKSCLEIYFYYIKLIAK